MLNQLIENTFKNTRLRRIRVKTDPSIPPVFGYENVTHFEGYILEECGPTLSVYIINAPPGLDPIQSVSIAQIEEIPQPAAPTNNVSYENLKLMLLKALVKAGFDDTTAVYNQIKASNNPEFVKTFLDQAGIKPEELVMFAEATATASVVDPEKEKDLTFGRPEPKGSKVLNLLGKGLVAADKALGTASELIFDRDKNIIGRLTRFLKTFDVNDLVNLKSLKLKSKDYPVTPHQEDPVFVVGLPRLSYFRKDDSKYQIKGKISGIKYSNQGLTFIVKNLEPTISGLESILLDFSIIDNPSKTGKAIFIFNNGKRRFSQAQITGGTNGWNVKVLRYGISDTTSESKKGIAFILLSNNLLSSAFGAEEAKQIIKNPEYNDLVMGFAEDLKKFNKSKLEEIESVFVNLKNDEEFNRKTGTEKLNNLKELIKFIKDNI